MPGSAAPERPRCYPPAELARLTEQAGEPLSLLATAAAREALADAGIAVDGGPLDDVGLVMNTALGPSGAVEVYLERLAAKGPRACRPAMFVDTLLSMPASRLGIGLGLRGSTAVLGGSDSFELALDWLRAGREHTLVCGGGDYASPKCATYLARLAGASGAERAPLASGAAFLVLEERDHARERGARARGELLGAGSASEPQERALPWSADREARALAAAMRGALEDAGVAPGEVGAAVLAAGDDTSEAAELTALRGVLGTAEPGLLRPKRLLGEALAASGPLAVLAALAQLPEGAVALVNAFEAGGAAASLVLRVGSP